MPLSWVEIHGALTHMPLACLLLSPLFEVGAALWHKPEWRVVSFWLLVAAVVVAVPSLGSGWITGNDLRYTATGAPPALFINHRLTAFVASGLAAIALGIRVKTKDRTSRATHIVVVCLSLAAAAVVGLTGYLGGKMVFGGGGPEPAPSPAQGIPHVATASPGTPDPALLAAGTRLVTQRGCQSCHMFNGKGAAAAPDLTHEGTRHSDPSWQLAHLLNPPSKVPGSSMPPQTDLPANDLQILARFLASRS